MDAGAAPSARGPERRTSLYSLFSLILSLSCASVSGSLAVCGGPDAQGGRGHYSPPHAHHTSWCGLTLAPYVLSLHRKVRMLGDGGRAVFFLSFRAERMSCSQGRFVAECTRMPDCNHTLPTQPACRLRSVLFSLSRARPRILFFPLGVGGYFLSVVLWVAN